MKKLLAWVGRRMFSGPSLFLVLSMSAPALSQSLVQVEPESVGLSSQRLKRLDAVVETAIQNGEIPGAVLLVAHRGRTVYRKAFGMRSLFPKREPMTIDTIFDLASLTKVVATAPSVMLLVEEGKLSLTDRVSLYLPGFASNRKSEIRLIDLLTHYSGLRPDIDLEEPWEGYQAAIERAIQEQPLEDPKRRFIYSDINYFVLADLVQRVSGRPFQDFATQRLFQPMGMLETWFNPPSDVLDRVAPTERAGGQILRGSVHDPTARRMGGVAGHAGLFSTAQDLAFFSQMILEGGSLEGVDVLSPLTVRTMISPQSPPGQLVLRGLGFDIRSPYSTVRGDLFPPNSVGHTGFTGTSLWIDPITQTFVILLTSRLHPDGSGNVVALRKKVASVAAASIQELVPRN